LIEAFTNARLFTSFLDRRTGAPSVQLVHEAVLQHWPRANAWAQENYASIRFRAWLTELAERWKEDARAGHYLLRDGKMLFEAERLVDSGKATEVADFVTESKKLARRGELGHPQPETAAKFVLDMLGSLISTRLDELLLPTYMANRPDAEFVDEALTAAAAYLGIRAD